MLISAIPPTFPWLITGLSAGLVSLSPMACRFNVQPVGDLAVRMSQTWLPFQVRESTRFPWCICESCVVCVLWIFLFFVAVVILPRFFVRNKKVKSIMYWWLIYRFCCHSVRASHSSVSVCDPQWQSDSFSIYSATDNKWPQNLSAFLGILHHNEICPLSMNLPPPPLTSPSSH